MPGRRAGDLHLGGGGDAAVEPGIGDRLPGAVDAADFGDGDAVGGHLDADPGGVRIGDLELALDNRAGAREHQMRDRILVVDHEQAVRRGVLGIGHRNVADEVIVVAELLRLAGRRLPGPERPRPMCTFRLAMM